MSYTMDEHSVRTRQAAAFERIAAALETIAQHLAPVVTHAPTTDAAPGANGWIEWHGGECPLPDNTAVDLIFGDGKQLLRGNAHSEDPYWALSEGPDRFAFYRPSAAIQEI